MITSLENLCKCIVRENSFVESKLFESFPNGCLICRAQYLQHNDKLIYHLKHFENLSGFKKWFINFILQNIEVDDKKVYDGVSRVRKKIRSFRCIYGLSSDILNILDEIDKCFREILNPKRTERFFSIGFFELMCYENYSRK